MQSTPRVLPPRLLERPVEGTGLRGPTLADQLGPGPTLVAFLRHFG